MPLRIVRSLLVSLALLTIPPALLGCGGGASGDAGSLLRQTFGGARRVDSGVLQATLTIRPSGSATGRGPISLSFGGSFQSRGSGRVPRSDFTVSLTGGRSHLRIGVLSTGTAGYVSLGATSYRLPAADFRRLAASFGSVTALGVRPLRWLTHPTVVGAETIAGVATTHVRATIDVRALLGEVPALLARASALGVSGASLLSSALSPAGRSQIAAEIRNPTVDVWTGTADRTLRRAELRLTVPADGRLSRALGGLAPAQIALTLQYAQLNRPQPIVAPAAVQPYGRFGARLRSLLGSLPAGLTGG